VQQGVSNAEACRIVGINFRTGKRWRNGRTASGGHVTIYQALYGFWSQRFLVPGRILAVWAADAASIGLPAT
jgi:hypothetical protein